MKRLAILGASGSIGKQTLDVCRWHPTAIQVSSLAVGRNWAFLAEAAREFRPRLVAIREESVYPQLKAALADLPVQVEAGEDGVCEAAAIAEADMTLAAISGMAGLKPLFSAIQAGKDIALANKEALVAGGELVMNRIQAKGLKLAPVDSEHSAIWQCLAGEKQEEVARLILTASGGAFRDLSLLELEHVTAAEALKHPNWRMGAKITVDCATMVNKGLEVIEAHWLFDVPYDRIDVVVHPESMIHSAVAFQDGSIKAQLAQADMRLPIQYALLDRERPAAPLSLPDLPAIGALHFREPDLQRFPGLAAMRRAGERGGTAPAYLNGANEVLVQGFLAGKVPFLSIGRLLGKLLDAYVEERTLTEQGIFRADALGREDALAFMEG